MQFTTNGPDIPEHLLQAHEDGRVVLFCGAGISYSAGLPGFKALVEDLYEGLGTTPNAVQRAAFKAGHYDTAIALLEADIVGGRAKVRKKLAEILQPDLGRSNACVIHEALLTLSKTREGQTRLITTNFDRLFEEVIAANTLTVARFEAPLLPVPKSRWDGLVYLHGLMSSAPTAMELDRLVVSSGDFGLAYLTERWAARFVSELFRSFTVCFVGYSIHDPVMRYMMDALAADRLLGDPVPEIFAFGSYSKGREEARAEEWRAKNVTPILYREHNRHAYLRQTLAAWSETYRDGVGGKEHIVTQGAMARPRLSTKQDDLVPRMLWALSEPSGLPAKRFAEMDPVPSLDWLEPLSEARYDHADLGRFGVLAHAAEELDSKFSLLQRPAPYRLAPPMVLIDWRARHCHWDKVMTHLAQWLTRHLDDPTLVLWLAKRGGRLHECFVRVIERRLDELEKLQCQNDNVELERIRVNAPNAIPRPAMRTLWRLLLIGRIGLWMSDPGLHLWCDRFKRDGFTTASRLQLRELLTPRILVHEPWPSEAGERTESDQIGHLVRPELVLSADHVHGVVNNLARDKRWSAALPSLLADFRALLRDALDLMREFGQADDAHDHSLPYQPSIGNHPQNGQFRDWTALIDLTRDAWLATADRAPQQAAIEAELWWQTPFLLFRRLAFFAAAQGEVIPPRLALDWLLARERRWLWLPHIRREAMRLLVALAPRLDAAMLTELEQAILAGPPATMFSRYVEPDHWSSFVEWEIWLRLAKIAQTNATLSKTAQARLDALSAQYPHWKLADDQREEFAYWTTDDDPREFVATPRRRRELIEWLRQYPSGDHRRQDDWQERCRNDLATTAYALCALAREESWPEERWAKALWAWSEEKHIKRAWRYMARVVAGAPEPVLQALAHEVGHWLQTGAKTFDGHEECFMTLAQRVLELDHQVVDDVDDPVGRAINSPVGEVTEALILWSDRGVRNGAQGLPEWIRQSFTGLCDPRIGKFRDGRVMLGANLPYLFRIDPNWTAEYLLPLFDWEQFADEARAVWTGFLWNPRLHPPLMQALKRSFLATAHQENYQSLGSFGERYASLLTFVALDPGGVFTRAELEDAIGELPPPGLQKAAEVLVREVERSGDQRASFWANRVVPYLQDIWPKSSSHASPAIAVSFARLCVAAQESFPEAVELLKGWLEPLHDSHALYKLEEAKICSRFPGPALDFLDRVTGDQTFSYLPKLKACLEEIRKAKPTLQDDRRFERLEILIRQHGM